MLDVRVCVIIASPLLHLNDQFSLSRIHQCKQKKNAAPLTTSDLNDLLGGNRAQ